MRLFVIDSEADKKIYLKASAETRQSLKEVIGGHYFKVEGKQYSVNDVQAEHIEKTAPTMALGGVVGVMGGVLGVLAGVAIGALVGSTTDQGDKAKTDIFNRSHHELC
ncbi:hypothetical protein [uncultured Pseudodesulfovibrio sp.]|uniref:hypothetical protein n=1 Tax=uncultured Pseudodesulfovibrio sp. TaxID=2035858 RepID=UPI0029C83FAA|nr:hypothetical protein [uncultured Pseudodesulfovibrio sp.]